MHGFFSLKYLQEQFLPVSVKQCGPCKTDWAAASQKNKQISDSQVYTMNLFSSAMLRYSISVR